MSKETLIKVIDTTPKDFKAFVKLADIEGRGTTLILQRYLNTHIETTIGRDECLALFKGLAEHFGFRTDSDGDEAERVECERRWEHHCEHDWQRRICADIHQPDYLQCRKCDATKEL